MYVRLACVSKPLCYHNQPMADLAPGSTFAGHVIVDVAGRGGMGVVYHAFHEPLNRQVALKLIAPELSADERFRARFAQECKAAAAIHHPNVVPIYHAGEDEGLLYVTMRYVDGADLGRVLALEERLDPARAAGLVADLAGAIDAAHRLGIVHRDVKPANVLIEHRGEAMHPLLTDFGLAKCVASASSMTRTGAILGTLDYAAPEQLEEAQIDARTDVYALGCLLFHTLTGRVPVPTRDRCREDPRAPVRDAAGGDVPGPGGARGAGVGRRAGDVQGARRPLRVGGRARPRRARRDRSPAPRFPTAGARSASRASAPRPSPGRAARTTPVPFPAALAIDDRDAPFVGRGDIMDRLAQRYALADAGQRQFVVLCGEPGAGKTRVAARFARRAHAEGAIVLYGRSPAESIVSYQPFITALQQYLAHDDGSALAAQLDLELRELGRFIPGLRRRVSTLSGEPLAVEPDARRYRLFEAVTRVLAFIAAEQPVVLILDDLHWADTSTALLLRHIVRAAARHAAAAAGNAARRRDVRRRGSRAAARPAAARELVRAASRCPGSTPPRRRRSSPRTTSAIRPRGSSAACSTRPPATRSSSGRRSRACRRPMRPARAGSCPSAR